VRDADVAGLYDEVSATIAELRNLLSVTDPRWELFGLSIPANPTVPEGVGSLTVTAAGVGRLLVAWSYAVRAEYYRVFRKRVEVDDEAVNVAYPRDLEYTLKDLTPGTTVEVFVVPMNGAGGGGFADGGGRGAVTRSGTRVLGGGCGFLAGPRHRARQNVCLAVGGRLFLHSSLQDETVRPP
jgi:hypothetical protein